MPAKVKRKNLGSNLPDGLNYLSQPIHTVAIDERRKEFATVDLHQALQVGFRGVHADNGGGYENNSFDWLTRNFMVQKAEAAGIKFRKSELLSFNKLRPVKVSPWMVTSGRLPSTHAMKPTDNSAWFYNDHEPRKLPNNMLLHPSVRMFDSKPLNDIKGYRYLDE